MADVKIELEITLPSEELEAEDLGPLVDKLALLVAAKLVEWSARNGRGPRSRRRTTRS